MNNDFIIRSEKPEEYKEVEKLVRSSFWNVYCPVCSKHYAIHVLRNEPAFVKELNYVLAVSFQLWKQELFV